MRSTIKAGTLSRRGLSTIEVVVVILIIGILALLVVPRIANIDSQRDLIGVDEVAAHIRLARNRALYGQRTTRVTIAVDSNFYAIAVADTNIPPSYSPLSDPLTREPLNVDIADRFGGLRVLSVDAGTGGTLFFSSTNGVPMDAFGSPLTSTGIVTFSSGRTISISPVTGYVSVSG